MTRVKTLCLFTLTACFIMIILCTDEITVILSQTVLNEMYCRLY